MKAKSKELLDRAVAAMVASIEIYNKPDFLYREEAFAILAINGWELLCKAKWLKDNNNRMKSIYVFDYPKKSDGTRSKRGKIKYTPSKNPFTQSLDYLGKKLVEAGKLDANAFKNIELLMELRNSSVHFYNRRGLFPQRLQEIGAASLKNFVALTGEWFDRDLSEFNFYLMPLSFVTLPPSLEGIVLNPEEKRFLAFIESLEPTRDDVASLYSVTVNIDIKFTKSKVRDALGVNVTGNPNGTPVTLTEEQVRERYPWDYTKLSKECKQRYSDFKVAQKFHTVRKGLEPDKRFASTRYLDQGNPKSQKKTFYNPNILPELDKHFSKK